MILFGSSMSPFVRKVLAFAGEKGVTLESRPVGLGSDDPEFLAASPFRKMPAFQDGEFRIADSSAICHYLEAKCPDPALIPATAEERARTIWWDEFADTVFFPCGGKLFFNRVVAPRFLGRPGDEAVAAKAEAEELPPLLDYLEAHAPEAGGFLVGEAITLADIAVASPFANLSHAGVTLDEGRYPRLTAWVRSVLERPSFSHWIGREERFLAKTAA